MEKFACKQKNSLGTPLLAAAGGTQASKMRSYDVVPKIVRLPSLRAHVSPLMRLSYRHDNAVYASLFEGGAERSEAEGVIPPSLRATPS